MLAARQLGQAKRELEVRELGGFDGRSWLGRSSALVSLSSV